MQRPPAGANGDAGMLFGNITEWRQKKGFTAAPGLRFEHIPNKSQIVCDKIILEGKIKAAGPFHAENIIPIVMQAHIADGHGAKYDLGRALATLRAINNRSADGPFRVATPTVEAPPAIELESAAGGFRNAGREKRN